MMSFRTHYNEDGSIAGCELVDGPHLHTEFTAELIEQADRAFLTRDGDTITLHCTNGQWTYLLLGCTKGIYQAELI